MERKLREREEGPNDAEIYTDAGARVMDLYRQRIVGRSKTGDEGIAERKAAEVERKLRLAGLRAERDELFRIARNSALSDETARKLVREVDLQETRLGS